VPPAAAYAQAQDLLQRLGALEGETLTAHGQAMAELPAHPRIAHLLLRGQAWGWRHGLRCRGAAGRARHPARRRRGSAQPPGLLSGEERRARCQGGVQRARQLARQYRGYLRGKASEPVSDPDHPRWLGALLALAYPDRVAQQRRAGGAEYRLANGRAALFAEADSLMKEPWLVIADLGSRQGQREERIYLAADFDPALFDSVLAEQVRAVDQLDWDEREGVLRAERQRKVGELILSREPLTGLDEGAQPGAGQSGPAQRSGIAAVDAGTASVAGAGRLVAPIGSGGRATANGRMSATRVAQSLEALADALSGQGLAAEHFANLDLSSIAQPAALAVAADAWTSWPRITSACRRGRSVWITASRRRFSRCACKSCSAWPRRRASPAGGKWSSCTCCPRRGGRCR
jgi:ATP-dependent helicase HrpB